MTRNLLHSVSTAGSRAARDFVRVSTWKRFARAYASVPGVAYWLLLAAVSFYPIPDPYPAEPSELMRLVGGLVLAETVLLILTLVLLRPFFAAVADVVASGRGLTATLATRIGRLAGPLAGSLLVITVVVALVCAYPCADVPISMLLLPPLLAGLWARPLLQACLSPFLSNDAIGRLYDRQRWSIRGFLYLVLLISAAVFWISERLSGYSVLHDAIWRLWWFYAYLVLGHICVDYLAEAPPAPGTMPVDP